MTETTEQRPPAPTWGPTLTIKVSQSDTVWAAWTDDLPGVMAHGRSLAEALERFSGAYEGQECAVQSGQPPTILATMASCQVGMVVRHICLAGKTPGAGVGTVTSVGADGVHIHFADFGLDAIYDADWFQRTRATVRLELVRPS